MLFWDASAFVKHYVPEPGSDTVQALFGQSARIVTTLWSYTETYSIITRKHNDRRLSAELFAFALSTLQEEFLRTPQFTLLDVGNDDILDSVEFIERYSLNATDAALLVTWQRCINAMEPDERKMCVLVAADIRFVKAARAEGLTAVNPEEAPAFDVPALLSAL